MLPQTIPALLDLAFGCALAVGGCILIVLLLELCRRGRRLAKLPTTPTLDDLLPLGYHRGVCVAALRHLEAERAAGNLDYYRQPFGARAWNVWLPARICPETGGRRMELGDWCHDFIMGTLPTQTTGGEGGAA